MFEILDYRTRLTADQIKILLAFVYLGCWFLMTGVVYYFFGFETRGKSIEQIDRELAVTA